MTKIANIIGKYLLRSLEWLIILLFLFLFAIRTPTFQTFLGQQVTTYLSKELNHEIRIGKIDIPYYNRVVLQDVYAEGGDGDTMLNVHLIKADLRFFSLKLNIINLKNIVLKDGQVYLARDGKTGEFNFQYLINFFKPDKPKSRRPFRFKVEDLGLSKIHFKLDDNRKEKKPFGVDYAHLDADEIYLSVENINMKGVDITGRIKHLSLRENSGFILSKLSTDFMLSQQGMYYKDLQVITPQTSAKIPRLDFIMDSLKRFKSFVDDVAFDAQISNSLVSMKDVSYFAPALRGMDEMVKISADVKDRIKDLKIQNIKLNIRDKTKILANLQLPDFRKLNSEQIKESINYAYIDAQELNDLKLPLGGGYAKKLGLNEMFQRFEFAEIRGLETDGTIQHFRYKWNLINTSIGNVQSNHWTGITNKGDGLIAISGEEEENKIVINDFNLGVLIDNRLFGKSSGVVELNALYSKNEGISLKDINGDFSQFEFKGYNYQNINIENASYHQKLVNGKMTVRDSNADLDFEGEIDLNNKHSYTADIRMGHVALNRLNLVKSDSLIVLDGRLMTDIWGIEEQSYRGTAQLESFCLTYGTKEFHTNDAILELIDEGDDNLITLNSDVLDANIRGKIDFGNVAKDLVHVISHSLPLLNRGEEHFEEKTVNRFNYSFNLKDVNPILNLFVPNIDVSNGTKIFGKFSSQTQKLDLTLQSPLITIAQLKTKNINLSNSLTTDGAVLRYSMSQFYLNDSISPFESFLFVAKGTTDSLNSYVKWGTPGVDLSNIRWKSTFREWDDFTFNIERSLFTIDTHDWRLPKETNITYTKGDWFIQDFELTHDEQFITVDGEYSKKQGKNLDVCVSNLELEEITSILSINMDMQGVGNGEFHISNENNIFQLHGNATIDDLVLNGTEVGNINAIGVWDNKKSSIGIDGELIYRDFKTFNIKGDYYTKRKKDNLDFVLDFDHTQIDFLNAFMDPNVVSNIRGLLTGKVYVKGEPQNPSVIGDVALAKGNVKVGMFGVNYGFNGKVQIDDDMIFFNNLPLLDENGNKGTLTGSILHDHLKDFNFDIFIGLDDVVDKKGNKDASFLAMNTNYKDGTLYYGKAFVNGWVGISGYFNNLNIEVNLKTKKNTSIVIPMYGSEEVNDAFSYHFHHPDSLEMSHKESKINMRGVRLNLNFDVTPDALIKLVFDEQTDEEIAATGSGQVTIKMSNESPLSMDGTYVLDNGYYNFVYNPIRKQFLVEKGSSVSWQGGGPEDAILNIKAIYKLNTDITPISPELESKVSTSSTQNIDAIINVNGNLDAPQLAFEISAPSASESAKASLDRINNDNDELNKQFFMLLLTGHFQSSGIAGIGNGGANAALEALSGQINNLLDAVSKDVRLNVDLRSDDLSGKNSQAIGFKTNLLDNKLIIKGNFGVENNVTSATERNTSIIGDLSVEYVIDNAGNFTVKAFNESNSYSAIQDKALGMFTQGFGLVYSESFNKFRETNFANFIADIFRRDKYFKYTKKRRKKLLPELQNNMLIPERELE